MKNHSSAPVPLRLSPGMILLGGLACMGILTAVYRLVFGLQASTNLDNQYPWGIWIAIDVASGVALAAGGFTTAALTHIFHHRRYEPFVRPALLTAMLGYTFVVLGLMMDLGRYYNIWHPMLPTMWQGNSVLFEVGMCVMVYLNVLYIEFVPIVCERFVGRVRLPGPLAMLDQPLDALLRLAQGMLGKVMTLFIIAGVVLSCMHQSSLGALMLIAPYKVSALWYTPVLPLLFLLSAMAVGFPMVIFESLLASWLLRRKPEMEILAPLSRFILLFLGIYGAAKISDFMVREAYLHLFEDSTKTSMFLLEILIGIIIPYALLMSKRVRRAPVPLFLASALIVCGVVLNRINVFLVSYTPPYAQVSYFPSMPEILMTVGLISTLVLAYRVLVGILPVLPAAVQAPQASANPHRVAKAAIVALAGLLLLFAGEARAAETPTAVAPAAVAPAAEAPAAEAQPAETPTAQAPAAKAQPVETMTEDATGDCSSCHSSDNPSATDLKLHQCSRTKQQRALGKHILAGPAPDFFILDQLSDIYVPVVFPHRLHAEMEKMGGGCEICHHHGEPGKTESCRSCHNGGNNPDNLRQPGLKGAYHRQCLGCHREWSHETDCIFCHAKRGTTAAAEPLPQHGGDITGRLHPNVTTPERWVYPTPALEEGTMVTFHHKQHVQLYNKKCVNCHVKENCSNCHAGDAGLKRRVRQDPHEDCTRCHDVTGDCTTCHLKEETTGFDHGQRSKFMLRPYHQGLACQKCHPDGSTFKGLRADCASCHVSDWAPAPGFDHARTGVITLNDKHKDADCSGCHPDGMGKPTKCNACHDGEWKYPDKLPGERIAPAQPAALAAK